MASKEGADVTELRAARPVVGLLKTPSRASPLPQGYVPFADFVNDTLPVGDSMLQGNPATLNSAGIRFGFS
jgi:hypothetical protein